jgi:hypothetical protein
MFTTMLPSLLKFFRYLGSARAQATSTRPFSNGRIALVNMDRYHSDPVYRRQQIDASNKTLRRREAEDLEHYAKQKRRRRETIRQRRFHEGYVRFELLNDWIRRSGWHKADLPWKKYRPELYLERVSHHCSGCNSPDHMAKLWWPSVDSETYLCGLCWSRLSWEEMCPKGFEDTATKKEFTARARELGITRLSGPVQ